MRKASGVFFADVIEIVLMPERKFGDNNMQNTLSKNYLKKTFEKQMD